MRLDRTSRSNWSMRMTVVTTSGGSFVIRGAATSRSSRKTMGCDLGRDNMPLKRTAADGRPQLNGKALGALLNRSPKRAMKPLPIPEEEQLRALSFGLKDTYQLLTEYLGD